METVYIKNMVCDRCKAAVRGVFESNGVHVESVDLGLVCVSTAMSAEQRGVVKAELERLGFEMLCDSRSRIVERIKSIVIETLRYDHGNTMETRNMSVVLADRLHSDYSALSKLFSAVTGTTIEKYVIAQKVELVKELLSYGELSLTEIALRLNYSSVAYLSAQFKSVTGMTPSAYKNSSAKGRKSIDRV